ncbi:MAG: hypothetical protein E7615_05090 [Ruminococcaceae bacterium]|nr:hypothetical protein [Oscillospiraceae bacterium]
MIFTKIFDTHCDTAYVIERMGVKFDNDETHLSLKKIEKYDVYEQMFAIWSSHKRTDEENWEHFHKVKSYFEKEILPYKSEKFIPHLAVEGCALLGGDVSRVDKLKEYGVRMMTLVWRDECCMGGAHNTNIGLTDFGKNAVRRMFELDITPDISHASDKMAYETFEIAAEYGKPVFASHSNLRSIRTHTRNMTDDMFKELMKTGGLAGLNFCCEFLEYIDERPATITNMIRHLEHYLELGGENNVCIGSDFDGIKKLPVGILGVQSHDVFRDELKKLNYSDELIEKIFYNNAKSFFDKH